MRPAYICSLHSGLALCAAGSICFQILPRHFPPLPHRKARALTGRPQRCLQQHAGRSPRRRADARAPWAPRAAPRASGLCVQTTSPLAAALPLPPFRGCGPATASAAAPHRAAPQRPPLRPPYTPPPRQCPFPCQPRRPRRRPRAARLRLRWVLPASRPATRRCPLQSPPRCARCSRLHCAWRQRSGSLARCSLASRCKRRSRCPARCRSRCGCGTARRSACRPRWGALAGRRARCRLRRRGSPLRPQPWRLAERR